MTLNYRGLFGRTIPVHVAPYASEIKAEAILRVALVSLRNGATTDKLPTAKLGDFLKRVSAEVRKRNPWRWRLGQVGVESQITFNEFLNCLKAAFTADDRLQGLRGPSDDRQQATAWTFQTHLAFKFWFDPMVVPASQFPDPSEREVLVMMQHIRDRKGLLPSATLAQSNVSLWITSEMTDDDQRHGAATRLRDTLGLLRRAKGEHAMLFKVADRIADLPNVKAPTALDAAGYERFRSWPPATGASSIETDVGRTYELNPLVRSGAAPNHGRPEMVILPTSVSDADDPIYLGQIERSANISAIEHNAFADDIAPGTTVRLALADLCEVAT